MFSRSYSHYLSYGATDQRTARELTGAYDGLLVPGTVAAFQRQGTGGFVLSLSATAASPEYVIDPRFPLFQQALHSPKRSHEDLAAVLGDPSLVQPVDPLPADFGEERIDAIARHWAEFNAGYRDSATTKFEKYARRLHEEVQAGAAQRPLVVLAPYMCAASTRDPWWDISRRLFEATTSHAGGHPVVRVVALPGADDPLRLTELLEDVPEDRLAIWVSNLHELTTPSMSLGRYLQAIRRATELGKTVFALYGGFFGVLAAAFGLKGASHGIGFGEFRDWVELPQSGPPPPRYYLPQVHRYISQELAHQLWLQDRDLAECHCQECRGEPPIGLDYHSLMKHSVLCRSREIRDWSSLSPGDMVDRLHAERVGFLRRLHAADTPGFLQHGAQRSAAHLVEWENALRQAM